MFQPIPGVTKRRGTGQGTSAKKTGSELWFDPIATG